MQYAINSIAQANPSPISVFMLFDLDCFLEKGAAQRKDKKQTQFVAFDLPPLRMFV